ncbi:hypothetical protein CEP88_16170 [Roseobacter denitrificans]|uniref:hypothetical protein n=1 Tax=Roseobacter denitrificans TaxID=2434 RepID=UPI000301DF85|nr:hypothetical protein [Roseobacter denitrificans]AVL53983.1 hypothetical protein CEP88_16170 [Roseobacter denitrificans]
MAGKGPALGAVIFGLRARARASQNRATVFLVQLFLTVVMGLVRFVGPPLWQGYQRGLQDAAGKREG